MPNKVSARKRVRQNEARRVRNRATRSDMRAAIKGAATVISDKKMEAIPAAIVTAQSKMAKAAKRNIIKKNKLSRQISRMMKAANKAKAAVAA